MKQYNIHFKYVTIYVVGNGGDLSVGAPFCRNSPNKTIHIINENERKMFDTLSKKDFNIFNNMEKIITYDEFNKNFESLKAVIKAQVLGTKGDISIKNKLESIETKIMKTINIDNKSKFLQNIGILKDYAKNGVHNFEFGTAGIKD